MRSVSSTGPVVRYLASSGTTCFVELVHTKKTHFASWSFWATCCMCVCAIAKLIQHIVVDFE